MEVPFINLKEQQQRVGGSLNKRITKVLDHCQFILGPEVDELERELEKFSGASHVVTVSSGTDALLIMLMAEGIKAGDGILLPSFTYVATAEVICLLGAVPIFVDVDEETYQISPQSLKAKINEFKDKVPLKAILGVDLFGHPAPWEELQKVADDSSLVLLADTAQSFGGELDGALLGNQAVATGVSFFPSKPLGCYGDGGCILTNDVNRAELYKSLRNHGVGEKRYQIERVGLNARLDTLQSAILLSKLEIFNEDLDARRKVAERYNNNLPAMIKRPKVVEGANPAWSVYSVQVDSEKRDDLVEFLKANKISCAVYYATPLHKQQAYKSNLIHKSLEVSEKLSRRVVALPIYPELSTISQDFVIEKISEWAASKA